MVVLSLGSLTTSVCACIWQKETQRRILRKREEKRRVIRYLSSHSSPQPPPYLPKGREALSKPCHEFLTTLSVCSLRRCVYVHACVDLHAHVYIQKVRTEYFDTYVLYLYSPLTHWLPEYDAWYITYWTAFAHHITEIQDQRRNLFFVVKHLCTECVCISYMLLLWS